MRSKKQPLGLAKKRSLGRLGTESEVRAGHRRWPGGDAGEKRRPHRQLALRGEEQKGLRGSFRWKG